MNAKQILILIVSVSLISVFSVYAATIPATKNNDDTNHISGFKFSPIAHANTAELLAFITYYESLDKEAQKAVYLDVSHALEQDKKNIKLKIKHAVTLSLPNSSQHNPQAAAQSLNALLTGPELSESNLNLVKMLHIFTLEHNKTVQKERNTKKQADNLKQKNRALSRKLNDIKNIEKTMIERNVKTNNK